MRWISWYSEDWHDLMVCPLNQKELPAGQSPKPTLCAQLDHSKSDLAFAQQPSII